MIYENILNYEIKEKTIVITGFYEKAAPVENLVIPETIGGLPVEEIGRCAFKGCETIKSVEMPGIKVIGDWGFSDCTGITSVLMPAAETVGEYAFSGCTALATITVKKVRVLHKLAFAKCDSLESLSLDSLTTLGFRVFSECANLRSVELPCVETIADWAFTKCPKLERVELPNPPASGNKKYLTSMGWNAFYGCKSLCSLRFYTDAPEIDRSPISECGPVVRPGEDNDPTAPKQKQFVIYYSHSTKHWDDAAWRFYAKVEF